MTAVDTAPAPTRPPGHLPEVLLMAGLFAVTLAMYVVGQLLPWWVNGFAGQPYNEWALGQQDPKDLWPQGGLGFVVGLCAFFALMTMYLVPWVAGGGAAVYAVLAARQRRWGTATVAVLTLAACVGLLAFHFSPLGMALTTWRLD